MTTAEKIKTICDHYDEKLQKLVVCEELGELIQEVSKSVRQGNDYAVQKMLQEIADVWIILNELVYMNDISVVDVNKMIDAKLDRQLKRIEDEREHNNQGHD